jgi:calcineurin-like phosphoesterase family protein
VKGMGSNTYLIGDTHFDHEKLMGYCRRPFASVEEMNNQMIENWNNTVEKDDFVFFMGDMAYGRGSRPADYWLKQLNGDVIFFRGNHDRSNKVHYMQSMILPILGYDFLFLHDTRLVPLGWNGWVVHGHIHNNYPSKFPLVNGDRKTINVGVELINYKPLLLEDLINDNLMNVKRWNDLGSEPVYYKKVLV